MIFFKKKKVTKLAKPQDEEFISDSQSAILTRTTPIANIILLIFFLFIIIGLIWAYFADIDVTTSGQGVVLPFSYVKVIQSLDGGIVVKIFVREADIVKKGQPLVKLDDTRYAADYRQAYAKYLVLLAMTARLSAEVNNKKAVEFPAEIKASPELVNREQQLFKARRDALTTQVRDLQESYDLAIKQVKMLEPVVKEGIASQLELVQNQRSASEYKEKLNEAIHKYRQDAWTDFNERKGELAIAKENMISLHDKMVHTLIASPINGIVKKIHIVTEGGVIEPGVAIMEIVPRDESLMVQTRIKPEDIAFIHVGQSASVKITAYDYAIYGDLKGTVKNISADVIEEKTASGQPIQYYLVNVITEKSYLEHKGQRLPIMPGMNAHVQILTDKKTVLQYILKPLIKAKTEALRER